MGGVFIGAGGAGVMILFPLGIIYVLWYFLMMWGLNFRKNYSYWLNIFVHCLIVIVNIIRLFSIESDQLFGVKVSFITFSGIGVVISNVVFSLVLIGFSGYFVYVLFQKDVKKVF